MFAKSEPDSASAIAEDIAKSGDYEKTERGRKYCEVEVGEGEEEEEGRGDGEAIAFIQCTYRVSETRNWWKNVGRTKSKHSRSTQRNRHLFPRRPRFYAMPCQIDLSMHD